MKKLMLFALVFSLSVTSFICAQEKQTQKEVFATTYHNSKTLVESQHYKFVGETVFDGKKRERLDSDSNRLDINDTTIIGQLSSLSSENKIFEVKGEIENYMVTYNDDKQEISIEFSVNEVEYSIEIKPNGIVFLTNSSRAEDPTTWIGRIKK